MKLKPELFRYMLKCKQKAQINIKTKVLLMVNYLILPNHDQRAEVLFSIDFKFCKMLSEKMAFFIFNLLKKFKLKITLTERTVNKLKNKLCN
jgi:hypothetical protein